MATLDASALDALGIEHGSVIETLLSTIYVGERRVFKMYKHRDSFIGNLADKEYRRAFYEEDFAWNNLMDPSVYLALRGVRSIGGRWEYSDIASADDYFIEMKTIDTDAVFTKALRRGDVSDTALAKVVREMYPKIETLSRTKEADIASFTRDGWDAHQKIYYDDLRFWAYMGAPHLDTKLADLAVDILVRAESSLEYFKQFPGSGLLVTLDSQSENILIDGETIGFMDVMPPKENWRIADRFFNASRVATDADVLSGAGRSRVVYAEYEKTYPAVPDIVKTLYGIRSALLRCAYTYVLGDVELGDAYQSHILRLTELIPSELKSL